MQDLYHQLKHSNSDELFAMAIALVLAVPDGTWSCCGNVDIDYYPCGDHADATNIDTAGSGDER